MYALGQFSGLVYSHLVRYPAGPEHDPTLYRAVPDLARSIESPDLQEFIIKLDTRAKFHPPVSRPVDAEDIVFSVEKGVANEAFTRNNIYDSVEAIDAETVRIRLTNPDSLFLTSEKEFPVQPREAGSTFDPEQQMVGTGPFIFEGYRPGIGATYRRNPEWHLMEGGPYLETVEGLVIPEYSTALNQFLGGQLDELTVPGDDVLRVLRDKSDVQWVRRQAAQGGSYMSFSNNEGDENAPWRDPRVRHAVSMALNRDEMTEAAFGVSAIEAAGLDAGVGWNNLVPNGTRPFWLDPQGEYQYESSDPKMSPENLRRFAYDPEAAKQLLAEAGYPDGFRARYHYTSNRYGEEYRIISELIPVYLKEIGIELEVVPEDYASVYVVKTIRGDYDGLAHHPIGTGHPLVNTFEYEFRPGSPRNNSRVHDEFLISEMDKNYALPDPEEIRTNLLELQNYITEKMYYVPTQLGAMAEFKGFQANIGNAEHYIHDRFRGGDSLPYYWKA